jgi:RimJ/RimL family protein N-acetyltransferase
MMRELEKQHYPRVLPLLSAIAVNTLFARSVVEGNVSGRVFADDSDTPQTCMVVHPYGMSLLFGRSDNAAFNESLREYSLSPQFRKSSDEWLQASPSAWDEVLDRMFSGHLADVNGSLHSDHASVIERSTRVNFRFNRERYISSRTGRDAAAIRIERTDAAAFRTMPGRVVPSAFWDSEDDFCSRGVGFSLYAENQLAATAYSAFVHDTLLEIGIETVERFRGRGYARMVCSRLIDYCLEHALEPVWACRLQNTGSYNLALSLGFEPTVTLPYYRLCR